MTPVSVDVEGASTTFVNPAAWATDTGTSTLVDGFDAEDVAATAGSRTFVPTTGDNDWVERLSRRRDWRQLSHYHTSFSKRGRLPVPIGLEAIQSRTAN